MKRRNAECCKMRRPVKRTKITDSIYGSTLIYVKFLAIWAALIFADFILEFRFEYIWPFWLLLRSVYDSYKYQGFAFSVFFVFISLTSDMICYLFIPIQWLFFAASTYVWVQYIWHTDRGICLPTVSLWILFVYIEASIRLKDLKNQPFYLDLCRPFAAHCLVGLNPLCSLMPVVCIGYPVVTLGFGFKSYVGYRMRLRKQKEVAKENDFYYQMLQLALPTEQNSILAPSTTSDKSKGICSSKSSNEDIISNGIIHVGPSGTKQIITQNGNVISDSNGQSSKFCDIDSNKSARKHSLPLGQNDELEYMENNLVSKQSSSSTNACGINDFDENNDCDKDKTLKSNSVVSSGKSSSNKWKDNSSHNQHSNVGSNRRSKNYQKDSPSSNNIISHKDDLTINRLESDIKRLKADLQASRQCEQELRSKIDMTSMGELTIKNELLQLQQDNENLQSKLHHLVTARQQDKQTINALEKKLQEERKCKAVLETQLASERKNKKAEEAAAARAVAMATANARNNECTDICKARRWDLENDIKQLTRDIQIREDQVMQIDREAQCLRQYKDSHGEKAEVLMSALSAMQDKNTHLENSLSAETRLKLDLFSALGEAKRQLEIAQSLMNMKDKEIDDLKGKMAEVMAVMPPSAQKAFSMCHPSLAQTSPISSLDSSCISSLYKFNGSISPICSTPDHVDPVVTSNLDPNASVYTPKSIVCDQ
ncbi:Macoilin [Nymphon striatum]|nr:Macoilin [Nymphon striatum]